MKIFLLFFFLFGTCEIYSQSIVGTDGLLYVPTADFMNDKEIWFGTSVINKKYLDYNNHQYNIIAPYITLAFLPFLEVSARINRMLSYPHYDSHSWDRMPSFRIKLLKEQENLPGIIFGMHDFLRSTDAPTNYFNATYLVATKHYEFQSFIRVIGLHIGYSAPIIKSNSYQLNGLFCGVNISPVDFMQLITEYDTYKVNCGIKILLLKHLQLTAALENFNAISVNMNVKLNLP